ncbi:lipocalin family protein [Hymenobacter sp. BT635]|uniref:Lipocalin family protein n=1 Tax=Hymenobacter nitidus TaxID=2880929 RepID=A0ABS8AGV4_9BACT|nr:lipocalin family protein [Hymenobacter nitidus]MCB2378694.1 lipocalin family protein [Hymenobacter nitidus]
MQRSSLIALSLLLSGALGACKKDKTETKQDLLVGKDWQVAAATVTYAGAQTSTKDAYAEMNACEKDNYLRFKSDKTLEVNEGKNLCPDSEQMAMGTWDINADQTKLYLNTPELGNSAAAQSDIIELTSSKLVLKNVVVQPDETITSVTTFSAK